MAEHPIEGLMKTTMNSIKEMVDVNTIVGDPVQSPDGLVIIPISRVSFGFASGGTEFSNMNNRKNKKNDYDTEEEKLPFGGGAGAGVSIQPIAFMVVGNEQIKMLPVDEGSNAINNIIDLAGKLTTDFINKSNKKGSTKEINDIEPS